jgi:hypothetical protein
MENVVTAPFKGKIKSININGRKTDWMGDTISYEQLFRCAYPEKDKVLNFSAAYEYPQNIDRRGKIFHPDESVTVYDGMIFNIGNY